jgi:hypothetical protein
MKFDVSKLKDGDKVWANICSFDSLVSDDVLTIATQDQNNPIYCGPATVYFDFKHKDVREKIDFHPTPLIRDINRYNTTLKRIPFAGTTIWAQQFISIRSNRKENNGWIIFEEKPALFVLPIRIKYSIIVDNKEMEIMADVLWSTVKDVKELL